MARGNNKGGLKFFLLMVILNILVGMLAIGIKNQNNVVSMPLNGRFIIGKDTVAVDSGIVKTGGLKCAQ